MQVNGEASKASRRLRPGDEIRVVLRPPEPARAVPQEMDLEIVFEDEHLIVVDKPAGLVMHPAPGHPDRTLVNALLAHCSDLSGVGGELRPGIVHRLDKDTSGLLVASKNDATHQALAELFANKQLVREYLAVVAPPPGPDQGKFETLYGRHPIHRKKFSSRVQRGKSAVTRYWVERRYGELAALVRCRLGTGRTHQIRVHFADAGMGVLGDPVYGRRPRDKGLAALAKALGRQALHAARLDFVHPMTGAELAFSSELPEEIKAMQRGLDVLLGSR